MDDVERRMYLRSREAAGVAPDTGAAGDDSGRPRRSRGGRGRGRRSGNGDGPVREGLPAERLESVEPVGDADGGADEEGFEEDSGIAVTPEPEFPANWDSMDDVERRLYLRQRAVAVGGSTGDESGGRAPSEGGERRRRPRRRGGRGRRGGGGGRGSEA